jgi:hypothetical protein
MQKCGMPTTIQIDRPFEILCVAIILGTAIQTPGWAQTAEQFDGMDAWGRIDDSASSKPQESHFYWDTPEYKHEHRDNGDSVYDRGQVVRSTSTAIAPPAATSSRDAVVNLLRLLPFLAAAIATIRYKHRTRIARGKAVAQNQRGMCLRETALLLDNERGRALFWSVGIVWLVTAVIAEYAMWYQPEVYDINLLQCVSRTATSNPQ